VSTITRSVPGVTHAGAVCRLAQRREILDGATPCGEVEWIFVADARLSSLIIRRADGRLTVVQRDRFMGQMTGRLGYGRGLYGRRPVERLAGDAPVCALAESTELDAAAAAALERPHAHQHDDLLILLGDGGVATLVVADLFVALSQVNSHLALHDVLTGLANRQLLLDRLLHARARLIRHGGEIAVLFIDLDDFKTVNDSLGHSAGDEVLVAVARRLSATLRAADTVARLGGDEFAVLLHDGDTDRAQATAGRILDALREPMVVGGRRLDVNASIGIAVADASTPAELVLRNADLAMYGAKHAGKRRSAFSDPSMHAEALSRLDLKADLERALDHDELYLVYQPVIYLGDGHVVGVEALLRWRHPQRGVLAPGEFIGLAEETGAIVPIGRWILDEACHQARRWQEATTAAADLFVAVNVSPRQLEQSGFVADTVEALAAAHLRGERLVVELTEGIVVSDLDSACDVLAKLRRLGVKVAIDDFGTGFTSLSYLQRLPIDILKVDRTFVADIATDPQSRRLLDGLLRLADGLRVTSLAEGVETCEQLGELRHLRCTLAQGYLMSRPLNPAGVLDRITAGGTPQRRSDRKTAA